MYLLLIKIWEFAGPCWIVNILHNFIAPLKKFFPYLNLVDRPLDQNKRLLNNRILGNSITYFGLIISILSPFLLIFIFKQSLSILLLKSLCTYCGGALGSFIKRQFSYPTGTFMPFVDHGDYIVFTGAVFLLNGLEFFPVVLISVLITYIFHPLFCILGYKLHIKSEPY